MKDLVYCKLCSRSLPKHGHVYSKTHRSAVSKVFAKFEARLAPAVKAVERPAVDVADAQEEELQTSREETFWCYFCEAEEKVNEVLEENSQHLVVRFAAMIEHLSGGAHVENVGKFFRNNCIRDIDPHPYSLSVQQFGVFRANVERAKKSTLSLVAKVNEVLAETAAAEERERTVAWDDVPVVRVAKPPPAKKTKAERYPNRVGANFDRSKPFPDDWLPNFGSVWQEGPRSLTRSDFIAKRMKSSHEEYSANVLRNDTIHATNTDVARDLESSSNSLIGPMPTPAPAPAPASASLPIPLRTDIDVEAKAKAISSTSSSSHVAASAKTSRACANSCPYSMMSIASTPPRALQIPARTSPTEADRRKREGPYMASFSAPPFGVTPNSTFAWQPLRASLLPSPFSFSPNAQNLLPSVPTSFVPASFSMPPSFVYAAMYPPYSLPSSTLSAPMPCVAKNMAPASTVSSRPGFGAINRTGPAKATVAGTRTPVGTPTPTPTPTPTTPTRSPVVSIASRTAEAHALDQDHTHSEDADPLMAKKKALLSLMKKPALSTSTA